MAAVGASEVNLAILRKHYSYQTIGPDKLNQLRHIYFLRDMEGVHAQMQRHRKIIAPKFQTVLGKLRNSSAARAWPTGRSRTAVTL